MAATLEDVIQRLQDFIAERYGGQQAFAAKSGVAQSSLSRI